MANRKKVVIIGALGYDFHCFNTVFRENDEYEVCAFTIAGEQNVGTLEEQDRKYPPELAGKLYPNGIPMIIEPRMEAFIKDNDIEEVVFAYSDVPHAEVMHKGSRALAYGANYRIISPKFTQIKANKPVVAITAVRTGCGKSKVSRAVYRFLQEKGYKVVAVREPMPYGNLIEQTCMRFAEYSDLDKYKCTIEEREEYEPYIEQGLVIYSGVDYQKILDEAEKEADIVVFDGGNNEVSFYVPDLMFTVVDPLRPGHEVQFHPGEVNARMCDAFVLNKLNSAKPEDVKIVEDNMKMLNPNAVVVRTDSIVTVEAGKEGMINGKNVLVVEDGPTLTHGMMAYGAGMIAARENNGKVVDPKPYLVGGMKKVFEEFTQLDDIIPAMGYNDEQIKDMEDSINAVPADVVIDGSPIDLGKLIKCNKPIVRIDYDIKARGTPSIESMLEEFIVKFAKK